MIPSKQRHDVVANDNGENEWAPYREQIFDRTQLDTKCMENKNISRAAKSDWMIRAASQPEKSGSYLTTEIHTERKHKSIINIQKKQ